MRRAWLVVGLLFPVALLNYLDRQMIASMKVSVMGDITDIGSEANWGHMLASFKWVYAIFSPIGGYIADRFSRKLTICGSLFVWSLITWLTGHVGSFNELYWARTMMGISEAFYIPAALALIADYHRGGTRSLATGLHMIAISIGAGLGGLGGLIAERGTWSSPFVMFGAIGVCYSVVLILFLRDAPVATTASVVRVNLGAALKSLFSHGSFILALLYWGLLGIAGWAVVGWLPTFFGDRFHLSQGEAGMSATGYLQPAAWVGILLGAVVADRWSKVHPRGRIFAAAISLALAVPCILLGSHTDVFGLALTGFMLHSAAYNFSDSNMMPILCMVTDVRYRATGYGLLNLFGCVVGGLTVYMGGALRDAQVDIAHIFEFAAAGMAVCAILLLCMKPMQTK